MKVLGLSGPPLHVYSCAVYVRIAAGLKFVERDPTLPKLPSTFYLLAYNLAPSSNVVKFYSVQN
jgi:hypothetical protein